MNTGMKIDTRSPEERTTSIMKKIKFDAAYAKHLQTYEECLKAAKMNGYAIGYMPKEFRSDPLIQMTAVKQDGWSIKFLIRDGVSFPLPVAIQAVKSSYSAFFFIKDKRMREIIKPMIPLLNEPVPDDLAF